MKFGDTEDVSYKYPATYLFPDKPDKRYSYFPSTAGTQCSFRKLSKKERKKEITTLKKQKIFVSVSRASMKISRKKDSTMGGIKK